MLTRPDVREATRLPRSPGSGSGRPTVPIVLAVLVVAGVAAGAAIGGSTVGGASVVRPSGLRLVGEFFAAALRPELGPEFVALTLRAALMTLGFAVLGTALSLVLGAVGGVLGSQTWWRMGSRPQAVGRGGRLAWVGTRMALVVPRGIHEVVWGLFLLSVLGIEPVVAVLAIAIPFGAITAKVFSEIIDDADRRPADTLLAAGASRAAAFCYAILPAAAGELVS